MDASFPFSTPPPISRADAATVAQNAGRRLDTFVREHPREAVIFAWAVGFFTRNTPVAAVLGAGLYAMRKLAPPALAVTGACALAKGLRDGLARPRWRTARSPVDVHEEVFPAHGGAVVPPMAAPGAIKEDFPVM